MPAATNAAERLIRGGWSSALPTPLVNIFLGWFTEGAARFLHQIILDEPIDVAIEHTIDVADLLLRPVVLHELIWLEHIAPDLAPEGDVFFRAADLFELGLLLLDLEVVQP